MLAGRGEEVRRIVDLLDRADEAPGQIRLVQIDGPIGIGKSSVLAAVLSESQRRAATSSPPIRVFLIHGDRLEGEAPLTPVRAMVEVLLGAPLEDLLGAASPVVLALRCAEALASAPYRGIIAVDDAQWIDTATQDFLIAVIQAPAALALTVLLVHRIGQEPEAVLDAVWRRGGFHEHTTLEALPDSAIRGLTAGLRPLQATSVLEAARGNPLFARAAVAAFRRHPEAERVADVLRLAEGGRTAVLTAAVSSDIAALPVASRRTLAALAVVGRPLAPEVLADLSGLTPEAVELGTRDLRTRGLLTASPHETLHPVVRYSAYQDTDPRQRADIHRRAAHLPEADLFEQADHLAQAMPHITAAELAVILRASAVALGSRPRAVLTWLRDLPPPLRTVASDTVLARALMLDGRAAEAAALLRGIVTDDSPTEARVLLANALRMIGETREARATLRSTTASLDARLLREYIDLAALLDGRTSESLLVRLEALPGEVNRSVAAVYRTMDLLSAGRVPQARAAFRAVPAWMQSTSGEEFALVLHAAACAVWCAYMLDLYDTGADIAQRALRLAERFGQADVLANLRTGLSFCQASRGFLNDADAAAEQAIVDAQRFGAPDLVPMARAGLMIAAQGRGDPELLRTRLADLDATPLPEFGWWRRAILTTRTRVAAMLGMPEPCPELLGEPRDAMSAMRYADAALVTAAMGEPGAARSLISEGIAIAEEQQSRGQRAMLETTLAEILMRSGDLDRSRTLLRSAQQVFEEIGMTLQVGRVHKDLATLDELAAQRTDPLAALTKRERQIASRIGDGLSNRQIAAHFTISHRTVENHTATIMRKLDVSSRHGIIALIHGISVDD